MVRLGVWSPTRAWEVCATGGGATVCSREGLHTQTLEGTQKNAKGCQEIHEASMHKGVEESMRKEKSRESPFY